MIILKKIEIFDPAMCCATGVCGPSVDPELIRIATVVHNLQTKGYEIKRYNLANDPDSFANHTVISQLLMEKGPDILPITLVNGNVEKERVYLTNEELMNLTGLTEQELTSKPLIQLKK